MKSSNDPRGRDWTVRQEIQERKKERGKKHKECVLPPPHAESKVGPPSCGRAALHLFEVLEAFIKGVLGYKWPFLKLQMLLVWNSWC